MQAQRADFAPEEWRPIPGLELYLVSSHGRVMRSGGRIRKHDCADRGIPKVRIGPPAPATLKTVKVAYLVAAAFLGPRPPGTCVIHKDLDSKNVHLSNLAYGAPSPRRGEGSGKAVLTAEAVRAIREAPGSHAAVAAIWGISPSHASRIRRSVAWAHVPTT